MKQEINVRLHHIDFGNCREIWISRDGKFYGRDTEDKRWFTLTQTYWEPDTPLDINTTFNIHDKNWKLISFQQGQMLNSPYPSFRDACRKEWQTKKDKYRNIVDTGFREWILSKAPMPLTQTDQANWYTFWYTEIEKHWVHSFEWLGETYKIYRVINKHKKCEACWFTYVIRSDDNQYSGCSKFLGYEFSDRISDILLTGKRNMVVFDPVNYPGRIQTTMADGYHCDYTNETIEQIRKRVKNENLQLMTQEELLPFEQQYEQSLQGPFKEISKDMYWYYLEVLPPIMKGDLGFFVSECYRGSLYRFCFKHKGRFFTALRSIRLSYLEIAKQISDLDEQITLDPLPDIIPRIQGLKDRVFRYLDEQRQQKEWDKDLYWRIYHIRDALTWLPNNQVVEDTYKGTIGYYLWLMEEKEDLTRFVPDTLHDLELCKECHESEDYAPRLNHYIRYFTEDQPETEE